MEKKGRQMGEEERDASMPAPMRAPDMREAGSPAIGDGTMVIRLAYDGARFSGFAEQPSQRTVAREVRAAIETFLRRPIELTCAGRTDAGVHAVAQYVSFPVAGEELGIARARWMRALSALLPEDAGAQEVFHAAPGFSARFDARERTYTYRIAVGEAQPVLTRGTTWWHRTALDVGAMEAAAQCLVGEHDFKSFCKTVSAVGKPTCRNVHAVSFACEHQLGEDQIAFTIAGNAFLHSMVRTIVGSLVEVGAHRRDAAWLRAALEARDRRAAGPTAPARGLCFMGVKYDEGALVRFS